MLALLFALGRFLGAALEIPPFHLGTYDFMCLHSVVVQRLRFVCNIVCFSVSSCAFVYVFMFLLNF